MVSPAPVGVEGRLLSSFLGIEAGKVHHSLANTSVSSLTVGADGQVSMDFLNRTPHLVSKTGSGLPDDRTREFYQYLGLMRRQLSPRPAPRGAAAAPAGTAAALGPRKQLDLSAGQLANRADFSNFLAKL